MTQEINVNAEFVVEIDAKYTKEELKEIIKRNLMRAFPNNTRELIRYYFKEEAEIYENK